MDEALLPYLQATSEAEKQKCLDDLLLVHASPVVRNILRERLGLYLSPKQFTSGNQEAEDLYHEILAKIVELVRSLDTVEQPDIRSFKRYVARIATNACHDYLRQKSPARARLKNNLRDLLNRHPDFALWRVDDEWFAGFANWPATKDVITASQRGEVEGRLHAFQAEVFPGEDVSQLPLSRLVAELFRWFDAAVELDLLVNLMARLMGVKDHLPESLDDESKRYLEARLSESTFSVNLRLDAKDILVHLWEAVRSLPINQRDTFCFSFSDQSGEDLFSLLIEAEVATFEEIARALGRDEAELAEVWSEMPMDRTTIAVELKASPPQVSKWRFRAVARLERQMFSLK